MTSVRTVKNIWFANAMEQLCYQDIIKIKSREIFDTLHIRGNLKSDQKKAVVFYCIYQSHQCLGLDKDFSQIAWDLQLKLKDVKGAFSKYSKLDCISIGTGACTPEQTMNRICDAIVMEVDIKERILAGWLCYVEENQNEVSSKQRESAVSYIIISLKNEGLDVDINQMADKLYVPRGTLNSTIRSMSQ